MRSFFLTLICFIYGLPFSYAQREADNWYFGNRAGITFKSGAPVALSDGQMVQHEGVATISDVNGNLLFYTQGATIWSRDHSVMQNGTGLNGDQQSAQAGVIVPMPNNPDVYYLFTVSNWVLSGSNVGLFYSVVDMRLNNGLGAVTVKNQLLHNNIREQVTSTSHPNCNDFWIVTHEMGSNNFLSYRLTPAGIQTAPVVSSVGMDYPGVNRFGYLRFSSNGTRLCSTLGYEVPIPPTTITLQLYDFDKTTGIVSNAITLGDATTPLKDVYSSEFSSDNSKLYVVAYNRDYIYQYDLSSGNAATIVTSRIDIANGSGIKTCLQMGPDKKIYVSRDGQEYLGVINQPDQAGLACNYVNDGVYLNGNRAGLGLPNFMPSFFSLPFLGVDTGICPAGTVLLDAFTRPGDRYLWQDGSVNPTLTVTQPGKYWVEVTSNGCINRDEIQVSAKPVPAVDLGVDTVICGTATIKFDAFAGTGATYLWQDGTTAKEYTVSQPGTYSVTVTGANGCNNSDAVLVSTITPPVANLGNDTAICTGASLLLDAYTVPGNRYLWKDGSTTSSINVSLPGEYWVEVANNGCKIKGTIQVTNKPLPDVQLGNDTILCNNSTLLLDASATGQGATYLWQDGSTSASFMVTQPGTYSVTTTVDKCSNSDDILVAPMPVISLGSDTTVCDDKTLLLQTAALPGAIYTWQDNSSQPVFTVTRPGTYSVRIMSDCGLFSDTRVVKFTDCSCKINIPNAFTPNNDFRNDIFKPVFVNCQFAEYNLKIFNRWGQVLFETKDPFRGWDGTFKGSYSDMGSYVYLISYRYGANNPLNVKRGTLILVR